MTEKATEMATNNDDFLLSISRVYRRLAGEVLDRAWILRKQDTFTPGQYDRVFHEYYKALLKQATGLLFEGLIVQTEAVEQHIAGLQEATKELDAALKHIEKAENLIGFAAKALAAIAATSAFAVAPSFQTAREAIDAVTAATSMVRTQLAQP